MEFTYLGYKKMIDRLRLKNYMFSNYHEYKSSSKVVVLRHDVDFSIKKALMMSELEADLGLCSTYFVLLATDFYNIATRSNKKMLRQINEMGSEVGLHFDEKQYPDISNYSEDTYEEALKSYINNELNIMSQILELNVCALSMHRPSKRTLNANLEIDGVVNSYSKTFFKDFKYISDSRMNWREDVDAIIDSNSFARLHILTHPFWYDYENNSIQALLYGFCRNASNERYYSLNDNFMNLEEVLAENEI